MMEQLMFFKVVTIFLKLCFTVMSVMPGLCQVQNSIFNIRSTASNGQTEKQARQGAGKLSLKLKHRKAEIAEK